MTVSTNHYHRLYRPVSFLIFVLLMAAGCAHIEKQAPRAAVAKQLVENSTTMEKRGDIVTAVEDLKIALTIDPNSIKAHAELNRLIDERNRNAEQHYRAGIAASNSNTQEARKEFLAALRLRPDYSESITALRELQLATAEAIIQVRLQKEAAHTKTRLKSKVYTEEDDPDMETYSLDIAVSAFEKGDYAAAVREFSKMKERYPNDPDIQAYLDRSFYNNGIALFNKKHYKKALESFSKVPAGFDNVGDYLAKCRQALKSVTYKKKK